MAITASQVNELRQKTGAGMMDCKKALTEADGDFEKAIEILRKKGASVAAKRAEKEAKEGIVLTKTVNNSKGYIVEINCETDFVANSKDFTSFAQMVLDKVVSTNPASIEDLQKDTEVTDKLHDVMGKIGEKIEVKRFAIVESSNGIVVEYVHMGSKLAVLIQIDNVNEGKEELMTIAKDCAMQIAAMRPICIYREEVDPEIVAKEVDIYKELARKEGKPEAILDKIATGRLNKFYQENCLYEQVYIKDNAKLIKDLISEFNKKYNSNAKIVLFKRFHLGDENK